MARIKRFAAMLAAAGATAGFCAAGASIKGGSNLTVPPAPPTVSRPAVVELGRALFEDKRLSADGTISCASCHQADQAFTDGRPVAEGIGRRGGTRNAPSLIGVGERATLTWDGRETRLEAQVLRPFVNGREHGLADNAALVAKVDGDPSYRHAFAIAFGDPKIDTDRVAAAVAAYLQTLSGGDSPYDRFARGDRSALSESALRGYQLFIGSARCAECHRVDGAKAAFTDDSFHRVRLGLPAMESRLPELTQRVVGLSTAEVDALIFDRPEIAALGRFLVTRDPRDIGAYRTPSLRNVGVTGPYMHDGSVANLPDAVNVEVYYRTQTDGRPIAINLSDRADLVEFLKALTDVRYLRP